MFPIMTDSSAYCLDCYRCLRGCPLKAIEFSTGKAKIIPEKCVLCGKCILECPQRTKKVLDRTSRLKSLLAEHQVALILSPTFVNYFTDVSRETFYQACCRLGFHSVSETTAADIPLLREAALTLAERDHMMIATHCPVIVNLVEQYAPDLIDCLLPTPLPSAYHSTQLKAANPDLKVVHVTGCISDLSANNDDGSIDFALTFSQFEKFLRENHAFEGGPEATCEIEVPPFINAHLVQSGHMSEDLMKLEAIAEHASQRFSGLGNCMTILKNLDRNNLPDLKLLELMACAEGCTSGPVLRNRGDLLTRQLLFQNNQDAIEELTMGSGKRIPPRSFKNRLYVAPEIDPEEVKKEMERFHQYTSSKMLNCNACGYDTCYQKSVAVVRGEGEVKMCMSYNRSKAESVANTIVTTSPNAIIVFDQSYIVKECNPTAKHLFQSRGLTEGISLYEVIDIDHMVDVVKYGVGVRNKVIAYPDLHLWTQQLIVPMFGAANLYLAIFVDITEQEKKREEFDLIKANLLEKANQVINEQMRAAQEIAGLLGETTAETKITLLKLIAEFEREKELT